MNKKARGHHIYSEFYLRGFATKNSAKKLRFIVFDLQSKKILYNQNSNNFGKKRDFNRIDIENIEPNALEQQLSFFETKAAQAIRNIDKICKFEGEDRHIILNMMALYAIRNQYRRKAWDNTLNNLSSEFLEV